LLHTRAQETFKDYEKEAKLKPFAKAALAASRAERVDPAVQAKLDAQRWLRGAVLSLAEQVEHFEARFWTALLMSACSCDSLWWGWLYNTVTSRLGAIQSSFERPYSSQLVGGRHPGIMEAEETTVALSSSTN
jgi:CCR4-NOT transcriptional regulation complex NOT5 subunit